MNCVQCGAKLDAGARFCKGCGAPLPATCSDCNFSNQPTAKFCGGCGKSLAGTGLGRETGHAGSRRAEPVPERRQVTVMFCDLAGSTSLATSLDLEDLRVVVRAFQAAAKTVISRHGGFISAFLGDGILVLFGYPQAHEDDPEQAVRAGLEIVSAVRTLRLEPPIFLDVRIGIATGLTVVGDLIGEGAAREEAVVGRTPNLAARLQSLAQPGEVIISDSTNKLVGKLFDCIDLGPQPLKGFSEPVSAWRVVDERSIESRFEAVHARSELSPIVGREREFESLVERWDRLCNGAGQVVLVRGEPGIGKSRISQALQERIATEPHVLLRYFCAPRFQNTALYPVIRQLEWAARLAPGDPPAAKLDKLEALLRRSCSASELSETAPYIATLLSISFGDRYPTISETPERQKERTLAALKSCVAALAQDGPVLLIWEDLHWIDPTSLEFIVQLVEAIPSVRMLLLVTSRPEFNPPWGAHPHTMTLELTRLERKNGASIIRHLTRQDQLPPQILDQILEKSDGVPLFIEELTKAVIESGILQQQPAQTTASRPSAVPVPSTLHDSLLARLDRLATGKEVAQVASAIGREFTYDLLSDVYEARGAELDEGLARLVNAGLIHASGIPPDSSYTFKHALIQEEAYATMLRDKRRRLHGRIAEVLEGQGETAVSIPELLAHHLTEAGSLEKAFPYWKDAGYRAKDRAAYTDGCAHITKALELLQYVPDAIRRQVELDLQLQLGYCMQASQGYAAPGVAAAYQRARELCGILGHVAELYPVLRGLYVFYTVRCEFDTARELAEQCLRLGKEAFESDKKRPEYLIEGYNALSYVLFYQGDLQGAFRTFTEAVELYRAHDGHHLSYPFVPQDPAVAAFSALAIAAWLLGDAPRADQCSDDALALAESLNRPFDRAYAHCFKAMFENIRRQPQRALDHAGKAISIAQEYGFTIWLGAGTIHLAIAMAALGQTGQALAYLTPALAGWEGCGAKLNLSFFLAGLSETHRAVGSTEQALEAVDRAILHATHYNEHFYEATLYRLRGELRSLQNGAAAERAEADLRRAIEIANQQGARMLELRAAISLHRLCHAKGHAERSRAALEAACQALEKDGLDSEDLREARRLHTASVQ